MVWMRALTILSLAVLPPINAAFAGHAIPVPDEITAEVKAGRAAAVIVQFDDTAIEAQADKLRYGEGRSSVEIEDYKSARYQALRDRLQAALPHGESEMLDAYSHLPMAFMRLRTRRAFDRLRAHASVRAIYANRQKRPVLDSQSQGLVNQPVVAAAGLTGAGTAAVVIDTGADYGVADLGACSAPGAAGCHLALADAVTVDARGRVSIGPDKLSPASASNNHGTNVASVIVGIAPGTHILMMNVFGTTTTASDAQILAAINWAIANQSAYNIRAINMSLGDGVLNTSPCGTGNPYVTPVANARSVGILTVVAAGNETYINGLSNPACTPGAVSVGAVYSGNFGGLAWSICTDNTTAADQMACFSNSAPFLTMLAPGALITAGGQQFGGTSQATPFVTGATTVLRAAYPAESLDQTVARMTGHGVSVLDPRNLLVKPRLDLLAASGIATATSANQDVPTLPEWAEGLFAILVIGQITRRSSGGSQARCR